MSKIGYTYVPYYINDEGKLVIPLLNPNGSVSDVSLETLQKLAEELKDIPRETIEASGEGLHVLDEHKRGNTRITFVRVKTE